MNFAVICPSRYSSGGPEALHQLVHQINTFTDERAYILYYPFTDTNYVNETYSYYMAEPVHQDDIDSSWCVVFPEVYPHLINEFNETFNCLWWLSVDYGPKIGSEYLNRFDLHMAQSHYAAFHLLLSLSISPIMLSDYIHPAFHHRVQINKTQSIAVNPLKGADLIAKFSEAAPEYALTYLSGKDRNSLIELLDQSSIYIDFGNHPGKDRIPREAAIRRCVVFVRSAGAADNDVDVPLDDFYKFSSIEEIVEKVRIVFKDGVEYHLNLQSDYHKKLESEPHRFKLETCNFTEYVCTYKNNI